MPQWGAPVGDGLGAVRPRPGADGRTRSARLPSGRLRGPETGPQRGRRVPVTGTDYGADLWHSLTAADRKGRVGVRPGSDARRRAPLHSESNEKPRSSSRALSAHDLPPCWRGRGVRLDLPAAG